MTPISLIFVSVFLWKEGGMSMRKEVNLLILVSNYDKLSFIILIFCGCMYNFVF